MESNHSEKFIIHRVYIDKPMKFVVVALIKTPEEMNEYSHNSILLSPEIIVVVVLQISFNFVKPKSTSKKLSLFNIQSGRTLG